MTTINAKEEGVVFFFLGQTTCPSSAQSNQKEMNRGGKKIYIFLHQSGSRFQRPDK